MKVSALFIVFLCSCLNELLANRTYFFEDEIHSLSELPLTELIRIKSTVGVPKDDFEEDKQADESSSRTLSLLLPVAQPLKRVTEKPMRRHGYHDEEKGKDTKISKIFQLSVTTLSFLAFGGYLLTLIITAIRQNAGNNGNGNGNGNGNVIVLSSLQGLQNYNRPKRSVFLLDPTQNAIEIEELYQGMILLSKVYATFN